MIDVIMELHGDKKNLLASIFRLITLSSIRPRKTMFYCVFQAIIIAKKIRFIQAVEEMKMTIPAYPYGGYHVGGKALIGTKDS